MKGVIISIQLKGGHNNLKKKQGDEVKRVRREGRAIERRERKDCRDPRLRLRPDKQSMSC